MTTRLLVSDFPNGLHFRQWSNFIDPLSNTHSLSPCKRSTVLVTITERPKTYRVLYFGLQSYDRLTKSDRKRLDGLTDYLQSEGYKFTGSKSSESVRVRS